MPHPSSSISEPAVNVQRGSSAFSLGRRPCRVSAGGLGCNRAGIEISGSTTNCALHWRLDSPGLRRAPGAGTWGRLPSFDGCNFMVLAGIETRFQYKRRMGDFRITTIYQNKAKL
jgi:hypothetical protein